jgi:hypothetical protein
MMYSAEYTASGNSARKAIPSSKYSESIDLSRFQPRYRRQAPLAAGVSRRELKLKN